MAKKEEPTRAVDERVTKPGYVVRDKTTTNRSTCEHGVTPWYNCQTCQGESAYQFKGF